MVRWEYQGFSVLLKRVFFTFISVILPFYFRILIADSIVFIYLCLSHRHLAPTPVTARNSPELFLYPSAAHGQAACKPIRLTLPSESDVSHQFRPGGHPLTPVLLQPSLLNYRISKDCQELRYNSLNPSHPGISQRVLTPTSGSQ